MSLKSDRQFLVFDSRSIQAENLFALRTLWIGSNEVNESIPKKLHDLVLTWIRKICKSTLLGSWIMWLCITNCCNKHLIRPTFSQCERWSNYTCSSLATKFLILKLHVVLSELTLVRNQRVTLESRSDVTLNCQDEVTVRTTLRWERDDITLRRSDVSFGYSKNKGVYVTKNNSLVLRKVVVSGGGTIK